MGRIRGALKLSVFAALTAVLGAAHFLAVPALRLLALPDGASRCSSRLFRLWARGAARTLGLRIESRGTPPRPPFILVSNHLGYVDVIVLASVLECAFVSRADVADWPVIGPLVRAVGTIFIDRDSKRDIPRALARIEETLRRGRGVVIFPEGTSSAGATVLAFRPSLLEAAARTGMPISCVTLTYRTPASAAPADRAVCWWGEMTFPGHAVRLFRLPGFEARVAFGQETLLETDRKALASRAHAAVLSRFEPVTGGGPV